MTSYILAIEINLGAQMERCQMGIHFNLIYHTYVDDLKEKIMILSETSKLIDPKRWNMKFSK